MAASLALAADAADACRDVRVRLPRDDARDEGAVERVVPVERGRVRATAREAAGDDHLRRRPAPLREPGGIGEPGRVQEGVLDVDAVVHDRDLDPFAACARQPGELRGADDRRAAVEHRRVREARVDLLGEIQLHELRQLCVRHAHGEAVQEHAVAARYLRRGKLAAQSRDRRVLGGVEPAQVRAREGAREVQLATLADGRVGVARRRRGERRRPRGS